MLNRSADPTLKISPEISRASMSPYTAWIVSRTWQNDRVCVPSPWISSGSPATARPTKRGMTIPYWPCWREADRVEEARDGLIEVALLVEREAENSSIAFESA